MKVASDELVMRGREDEKKFDDLCDPNWISSANDTNQEDVFRRYFSYFSFNLLHATFLIYLTSYNGPICILDIFFNQTDHVTCMLYAIVVDISQ